MHVHEKGQVAERCKAAGGHFNPYQKPHGSPESAERHVGDLGNIETDENGRVSVAIVDRMPRLYLTDNITESLANIIGRSVVIHAENDKFTGPSGDAGGRIGCGIIQEGFVAGNP